MTVVPLGPASGARSLDDGPALFPQESTAGDSFADALGGAFDAVGSALRRADSAERSFAAHRGGLQEMVVERARADIALSFAGAAASRTAQALSTILGMQV